MIDFPLNRLLYLSNRKFFVSVDNVFLEAGIVHFGVPQESILGAFLFLIYINDLPHSSEVGSFLNAGDTCIFYQNKDVHKIEGIPSGKEITKCSLFSKTKRLSKLKISYGEHIIKQSQKQLSRGVLRKRCSENML